MTGAEGGCSGAAGKRWKSWMGWGKLGDGGGGDEGVGAGEDVPAPREACPGTGDGFGGVGCDDGGDDDLCSHQTLASAEAFDGVL